MNLGERIRIGQSTSKGFHQPWKLSNVGNLRVDSPSSPAEKEAEEFAIEYSKDSSTEKTQSSTTINSSLHLSTTNSGSTSTDANTAITADSANTTSTTDSTNTINASGATEGTTLDAKQQIKVETALQERGTPLPEAQKNTFEQKLGRTLGEVRIHTGAVAEEAADSINARAFTTGKDIVFGAGEYRPETREGTQLLAHEMAHVAQAGETIKRAPKEGDDVHSIRSQIPAEYGNGMGDTPIIQGSKPWLYQLGLAIKSNEESIVTVGAEVKYHIDYEKLMLVGGENPRTIKWFVQNENQGEKELKEKENELDIYLKAGRPGKHRIIAREYVNGTAVKEGVYEQSVMVGNPKILKLSHMEKMARSMERSHVWDEIKTEIGDPGALVASMVGISAILILIAETGYGLAAEVIAGIIAAAFLEISIENLYYGIVDLSDFIRISGYAGRQPDLDKAGDKFGKAIAKIGVNSLLLVVSYLGARRSFLKVKKQILDARAASVNGGFKKGIRQEKGASEGWREEVRSNRGKRLGKGLDDSKKMRKSGISKSITPGLKFDGRLGKLVQHAKDWDVSLSGGPQAVAARVEKIVWHFYNNVQIIKQGSWRGGIEDAFFYSNGKHIVVTKSDGTFITILKNAHANKWFQNADKIWSK